MCVCAAGYPAEFDGGEGTQIGVFVQPDGTHVTVYGCEATADTAGRAELQPSDSLDWDTTGYLTPSHGSCMLMILPVKKGTFKPDRDLLDVSPYADVLKDIVDSVVAKPQPKSRGRGLGADMSFDVPFVGEVTHTNVGKFEVLTCTNARDLHKVVALVKDPSKQISADRPPLPELGESLQKWYGKANFVFLLAFFDGLDPSRSVLAARITPSNPKIVVFPGLDGHDPKVLPVPGAKVQRKHSLVVSVPDMLGGKEVKYTGDTKALPFTPPQTACGWRVDGASQNGDWAIPVDDLTKAGTVRLFSMLPPGAEKPKGYRQEVVACKR